MKNKLLVCFRPVAAVETEDLSVTVNSTTSGSGSSFLRKSKSFIIKSNTKLVDDDESRKIKRKETNPSNSGSFVLGFSLKRSSTMDLRNASKRNRFSWEDKCWDERILDEDCMNMRRIKPSLSLKLPSSSSSSSFDPDKKGEGCSMSKHNKKKKKKMMGAVAGAESRSRSSGLMVYLILVISLLTTVFYGRVCSVFVTSSSSCLFLCLPFWKKKTSLSIRSN